jgi:hypothetical protein
MWPRTVQGGPGASAQSGSLWGHEGHGGAYALVWEPEGGGEPLAFTGTAGNTERKEIYSLI